MTFDKTHLDVTRYNKRGVIHRDYIAHCHRWSFIQRWMVTRDLNDRYEDTDGATRGKMMYKKTHVLDIGCGKDLMLYKALVSNKVSPLSYTGVDINKLEVPIDFKGSKFQPTLLNETDICSVNTLDNSPNLVVSFEMLEHVPFEYSQATLKKAYELSTNDATLVISTPVFMEKYGMAKNHINEMTREQVIDQLDNAGWHIHENYGTFAGRPELYNNMQPEHQRLFKSLMAYYDSNVMATIFAPLYPEFSRNNLWVCKKESKTNETML